MESEEKCSGYARWSRRQMYVLMLLIALCAQSCKTPNTSTQTHRLDSLELRKEFEMSLVPVPMSVSKMAIPVSALEQLALGTGYNQKSGQATLDIRRGAGDSIMITATCDSLARQVIKLTEELTRIRSETAEVKETQGPNGWQWFWIRLGQLAAGAAALIALKWFLNKK